MAFEMEHHFVEINKIKLHVVSSGKTEGNLLIFLHGFPEFWGAWKNQIDHFTTLGYRVLVPDQRGYNLSDKPKSVSQYTMDTLAEDIVQLIHWAGHENAFIVGHDWGAAVSWWIALKHPSKVKKLVVADVPHPAVMKKNLTQNLRQILKSWYMFAFQLPVLPEWFLSKNNFRNLVRSLKGTSRRGTFSREDMDPYKEAWRQPNAISSMLNWYRASLNGQSKLPQDSSLSMPTLIIWGKFDRFLGYEMANQSMEYCKMGRVEILPEATHWVHHEEPQKLNQMIQRFLED